jgi:hypothetical protein
LRQKRAPKAQAPCAMRMAGMPGREHRPCLNSGRIPIGLPGVVGRVAARRVLAARRRPVPAMHVTLDQAIEIHAKALRHRYGPTAPRLAREQARKLASIGDREGQVVWLKVAEVTEALPVDKPAR